MSETIEQSESNSTNTKQKRGRRLGTLAIKPKYQVQYCDLTQDPPTWHTFQGSSQADISKKLKDNYHVSISRDIIQNIITDRFNKRASKPYLKITRIE